jgi:hypothetical protein
MRVLADNLRDALVILQAILTIISTALTIYLLVRVRRLIRHIKRLIRRITDPPRRAATAVGDIARGARDSAVRTYQKVSGDK